MLSLGTTCYSHILVTSARTTLVLFAGTGKWQKYTTVALAKIIWFPTLVEGKIYRICCHNIGEFGGFLHVEAMVSGDVHPPAVPAAKRHWCIPTPSGLRCSRGSLWNTRNHPRSSAGLQPGSPQWDLVGENVGCQHFNLWYTVYYVTTSSYPNCQCLKPSLWGWCIQIYTNQWWFWLILGVPTPLLVQTAAASSLGAHGASLGGVTRIRQPWLEVPIRIQNFWLKNTYRILRYIRFIYLYQISFASCKLRFKQELCPLTINRRVLAPQERCSAAWRGCCDLNIRPAPRPPDEQALSELFSACFFWGGHL